MGEFFFNLKVEPLFASLSEIYGQFTFLNLTFKSRWRKNVAQKYFCTKFEKI